MAPTTRSRKSQDATSDAPAATDKNAPASSKKKQPKLEESLGVESSDSDKKDGVKDDGNDKSEDKAQAGDKRERQADDDQGEAHTSMSKAAKTEDAESQSSQANGESNGAGSKGNDDVEKIMPGAEKPPQELKPGAEEEAKNSDDGSYEVLEEGHIYFFYRPKVKGTDEYEKNEKAVESIDDVQNTHMLLVPQASTSSAAPAGPEQAQKVAQEKQNNSNGPQQGQQQAPAGTTGDKARKQGIGFRLVRLGKKRLPAPEEAIERGLQPGGIGGDSSEAVWSVIADVGADVSQLAGEMGERRYSTRTRGERVVGPSRIAGRGRYSFVLHKTSPPSAQQVRLCYALSHPSSSDEMGTVQKELGLLASSSVLVSMRNPTLPSTGEGAPPAGLPESQRVQMDKGELKETFGGSTNDGGTRYARPQDMELLDREGVELLLTRERLGGNGGDGAASGAAQEQANALEDLAEKDGKKLSVDDVLGELTQTSKTSPPDALEGTWV